MSDDLKKTAIQSMEKIVDKPARVLGFVVVVLVLLTSAILYKSITLQQRYVDHGIEATNRMSIAMDKLVEGLSVRSSFEQRVSSEHALTDGKIEASAMKLDLLIDSSQKTNQLISVVISLLESSAARHSREVRAADPTTLPLGDDSGSG